MNRPAISLETLRSKADKAQIAFNNAMQINKIVTSDLWPDIKTWLERMMMEMYFEAREETDPATLGMRMGEWATLKSLLMKGETHRDIAPFERKLKEAQAEYLNRISV